MRQLDFQKSKASTLLVFHFVDRYFARPDQIDPGKEKKLALASAPDDGGRLSSSVARPRLETLRDRFATPDHRHSLSRGVQPGPLSLFSPLVLFHGASRQLHHHVV
jgi:hypothetical protein